MSELISGKEALIALANGKEVEYWCESYPSIQKRWTPLKALNEYKLSYLLEDNPLFKFRLKPRTITINGIEIPATFKPVEGDTFYYLSPEDECGYDYKCFVEGYPYFDGNKIQFGAWRTESEIKQVVAAQRIVFKPQ